MSTSPLFAISLDPGSSGPNETGAWRIERPVYTHALPPCQASCPAGEAVRDWLYAAEDGSYEPAWRRLMVDNPLPAVMGRICYHPCETACNRGQLDEAVGINSVERFLGNEAIKRGWRIERPPESTGRRVLIVGSGPSGLSAAYQLALLGHEVTVREAEDKLGGMLRYGIPRYRLPREVLDAEIARIAGLGVRFETGTPVDDLDAAQEEFDAVFLAVGAPNGKHAEIPAGDGSRIIDALSVLAGVEDHWPVALGRDVAVYGGGNTAMDVARTLHRLGAAEPAIVYRRTRDRMPAHEEELEDALAEGVRVRWLTTITHADQGEITVERMALDETGFPRPTGEYDTLRADTVILALGQDAELGWLAGAEGIGTEHGTVRVDPVSLATGRPGVYAGGDAIGGDRTATHAIGHGARAARAIDRYLRGLAPAPSADEQPVPLERLNTWYYSDAPATVRPRLEAARRADGFTEVVHGLSEQDALFEARRCLSCGNCFGCDNCYGVCPDNAITKHGFDADGLPVYQIDLDHCKGCGLCAAECPAGAITMEAES